MKKFLSVLLAVMMVLSTVSFALPSAVGTMETATEGVSVPEAVEEVVELAAATTTIEEDKYGVLLWNLDFEDTTYPVDGSVSNFGPVAAYTTLDTTSLPEEFDGVYRITMPAAISDYATINGSTAIYATGNGYPYFRIRSCKPDWTAYSFPNGHYTIVADYASDESNATTSIIRAAMGNKAAGGDVTLTSTMTTYALFLTVEDSTTTEGAKLFSTQGTYYNGDVPTSDAQFIGAYFGSHSSTTDKTYVDNFKVYWRPLTVDVTVSAGDKTVTKTISTEEPTQVASLASLLDLGVRYYATGAVIDGVEYDADDYITFTEDTEIELTVEKYDEKYVSLEKGIYLFELNFDDAEKAANVPTVTKNTDILLTDVANVNPYFEGYSSWYLMGSAMNFQGVEDGALKLVSSSSRSRWPQVLIGSNSNSTGAELVGRNGTYYFTGDYKALSPLDAELTGMNVTANGFIDGTHNGSGGVLALGPSKYVSRTIVADEWFTIAGSNSTWNNDTDGTDNDDINKITTVFNHSAATGTTGYYLMDNIMLYWKPDYANITISANGMSDVTIATPTVENVTTGGITVSELLDAAGVDYSAVPALSYSFKGVAFDTEPETVYGPDDTIYFIEDAALNLVFEEVDLSEWTDENGVLLFEINFDDATSFASGAKISTLGKVNPYFESSYLSDTWNATISYMSDTSVTNGEFSGTVTSAGMYPQIVIQANSTSATNTFAGPGYYTVEADMYYDEMVDMKSIGITPHFMISGTSTQSSGWSKTATEEMAGEYQSVSCTLDTTANEGLSKVILLWTKEEKSEGPVVKFDNVRLYWKPATVNVTIEGGSNENFETVTLENVSADATVQEIIDMLSYTSDTYGKLTNLAKDYEKIGAANSINATRDLTLTAVWTPWVEVEGGQEFAEEGAGVKTNNMWAGGNYGYSGDVGSGGDHTTAVHTMYSNLQYTSGGNMFRKQITPQIGDADIGTNDTDDTVQEYSIPAARTVGTETIRIQVITSLAAGNDAEYVLIKYRYNDLPDLADLVENCPNPEGYEYTLSDDGLTINYVDRNGEAASATLQPEYGTKYFALMGNASYEYAGGKEFHNNELMVEGEWYYDYLPMTEAMQTNGVTRVLIQHANVFHEQSTEIDYIRFVKLGEEEELDAPVEEPEYAVETSEEVSIREAAPSGIRFKASMDAETNEVATDYGWVVARDLKVSEAGLTYADITLDQTAFTVAYGYGRQDGQTLKNFYEEDDLTKIFTGVVYGIPDEMGDDVLVARPFIKVDGTVYYGEAVAKSVNEVKEALANA